MFIAPARSHAVMSYAGGIRIVYPGKELASVSHDVPT